MVLNIKTLTGEVKRHIKLKGFELMGTEPQIGIVPRKRFSGLFDVSPEELMPEAQSVIVIATSSRSCRNQYVKAQKKSYYTLGMYQTRMVISNLLVNSVAGLLEMKGFQALPMANHCRFSKKENPDMLILTTLYYDEEGVLRGEEAFIEKIKKTRKALPLKTLAVEAGLGEIGLSDCLISPEFGPNLHLSIVITDAELEPSNRLNKTLCAREKCKRCAEACPVGAIQPDGYDMLKCLIHQSTLQGVPITDVIKRNDADEKRMWMIFASFAKTPMHPPCDAACITVCPIGVKSYLDSPEELTCGRR